MSTYVPGTALKINSTMYKYKYQHVHVDFGTICTEIWVLSLPADFKIVWVQTFGRARASATLKKHTLSYISATSVIDS